jgi:hypothetical protein
MKTLIIILTFLFYLPLGAQELHIKNTKAGIFSLGARSSIGIVNDGKWQKPAFGTGGQFRIQFSDRINTDWFIDYLTADLADYAWRRDIHIGWSVIYYLSKKQDRFIQPYILAGHCFESLKFTDNSNGNNFANRWSASIQGGAGLQFNITERFDLSLVTQYMIHLGTKITAANSEDITTFTKTSGFGIQDHVLIHISLNYKIADLW